MAIKTKETVQSISKMNLKEAKFEVKKLRTENLNLANKLGGADASINKLAELNKEKAHKIDEIRASHREEIAEILKNAGEYVKEARKLKKKVKNLKKENKEWTKMFKKEYQSADVLQGILIDIKKEMDLYDDKQDHSIKELFSLIDSQVDMS